MARVTIERTLDKVGSRFELVVLAAYRAHAIYCGSQTAVNRNDKYAVLALREMECGKVSVDELRDIVVKKYALENSSISTENSWSGEPSPASISTNPVRETKNASSTRIPSTASGFCANCSRP